VRSTVVAVVAAVAAVAAVMAAAASILAPVSLPVWSFIPSKHLGYCYDLIRGISRTMRDNSERLTQGTPADGRF